LRPKKIFSAIGPVGSSVIDRTLNARTEESHRQQVHQPLAGE
jgi:hypothetical protein